MQTSLKTVLKSLIIIALLILWPNALAYNTNLNQFKNGRNIKEALYEPGQVLVKFKQDISKSQQEQIKDKAGIRQTLETIGPGKKQNIQLLELKNNETVEEAVSKLEEQDLVEYAEPNYIGWGALTPNDTFFGNQWGLNNTGQTVEGILGKDDADIDMPEAWENIGSVSKTTVIAVLDSGIDLTHPDLGSVLWQNSDEIPGDDIDNYENGYVDDVNGFNWANISQNFYFKGAQSFDYFFYRFGTKTESANIEIAQSFKGNDGYINEINIALKRNGMPTQGLKVSIKENDPDGAELTSVDIIESEIPEILTEWRAWTTYQINNWISKKLASPLKISSDNTYYIVISTNNQDDQNYYEVGATLYARNGNADRFPDGKVYVKNGSWQEMDRDDLAFKLIFDTQKNGRGGGIPRDDVGHGTHVSGVAGAVPNNNKGIAGIAGYPENAVKIMPLRVLDSQSFGSYADWAEAIKYAADNGADVINMSLVGAGYSQALQDAANYAISKGVIIIAAAGNDGDASIRYPAGLENVVGVGSTTNTDSIASSSNYNVFVDLSAPGRDIYSTTPTYPHYKSTAITPKKLEYDFYSGTSMATPAVSALAALIKAKWPDYTPIQIQQTMQDNADDLGDDGRDDYFGYGRINAVRIFDNTPPSVTINTTSEDPTNSSSIPITINFSEAVKGFEANNISVGNGAVQNFTGVRATYTADILPIADGQVSVNINEGVTQDEAGNSNTAAQELLRTYDSTPPKIWQGLTAQNSSRYVRGVVNLQSNVTDNLAISKVSYYIDSVSALIGTSYSSPYSVSWDTRKNTNGSRNILTYAYDVAGNQANTKTLLRVDNYKPRTYAPKKAKVKKGKRVKFYYKVKDDYTGNKAYVTIRIKKGKRIVKILRLGLKKINIRTYHRFLVKLAKGKYRFYIYAKDRAGNNQLRAASNLLVVT